MALYDSGQAIAGPVGVVAGTVGAYDGSDLVAEDEGHVLALDALALGWVASLAACDWHGCHCSVAQAALAP